METTVYKYAIVRAVPRTFDRCIRPAGPTVPIDVDLAMEQHRHYCDALESLGLELIRIEPDDRYPDCCFVEDPAVIVDGRAIVVNMGAPSRLGESVAIKEALARWKVVTEVGTPGTLDGGDVLFAGDRYFVGLTSRSNETGFVAFREIVRELGYVAESVPVKNALHLKSVCTHLGEGHLVVAPGHVDETIFCNYTLIPVSKEDEYSANCLSVNGKVLVIAGYPRTKAAIEAAGFETIELETTEFKKAGGSLTCLSIIF
ncbi:MAG: N(G),N(G)-dimethylarginine dimethylaminohydrolase [Candidatus Latescibacterota bacterium]|nr:MAG: N(G),N(G)-dimethylarginine dimethylaminohydrolase [Candidatus Latescibacterota bacterium]